MSDDPTKIDGKVFADGLGKAMKRAADAAEQAGFERGVQAAEAKFEAARAESKVGVFMYDWGLKVGRAERDAEVLSLLDALGEERGFGAFSSEDGGYQMALRDVRARIEEGSPSSPRLTVAAIAAHLIGRIGALNELCAMSGSATYSQDTARRGEVRRMLEWLGELGEVETPSPEPPAWLTRPGCPNCGSALVDHDCVAMAPLRPVPEETQ